MSRLETSLPAGTPTRPPPPPLTTPRPGPRAVPRGARRGKSAPPGPPGPPPAAALRKNSRPPAALTRRGPAAGDVEARTGREGELLARQEADERRDLVRLSHPPEWDSRRHVRDVLLGDLSQDRRVDHRRRDAVDEHAASGDILADRLRQ